MNKVHQAALILNFIKTYGAERNTPLFCYYYAAVY